MSDFRAMTTKSLGTRQLALLWLVGGVDSSVVAALQAGEPVRRASLSTTGCSKNERDLVETTFRDHFDVDLRVVDASEAFLKDLEGITEPKEERRRIDTALSRCSRRLQPMSRAVSSSPRASQLDVIESGHGHGHRRQHQVAPQCGGAS